MQWLVEGADLATGRDISIKLEAANRTELETLLSDKGIAWSTILEDPRRVDATAPNARQAQSVRQPFRSRWLGLFMGCGRLFRHQAALAQ